MLEDSKESHSKRDASRSKSPRVLVGVGCGPGSFATVQGVCMECLHQARECSTTYHTEVDHASRWTGYAVRFLARPVPFAALPFMRSSTADGIDVDKSIRTDKRS
jgi:hypothetical protein